MESFEKAEIYRLSLSFEERHQSNPAVSEIYFKNVVNELVKTKKYLQDLQISTAQDRQETKKLKSELQNLRFTAQHLQRLHRAQTEEINELKLKLEAYESPDMNDSFELEVPENSECCEMAVQTELKLVGPAGSFVNILQQKIDDLEQENEHLLHQYDDLKNKYDEQSLENMTIPKKTVNQCDKDNASTHQSCLSSSGPHDLSNFGKINQSHSFQQTDKTISAIAKPNCQLTAENGLLLFPLQNCFSHIDNEDNVDDDDDYVTDDKGRCTYSTNQLPFSRYAADEPTSSTHSFGSATNQTSVSSGVLETQPHQHLKATSPNCSQAFTEESNYINRLEKSE